MESAEETSTVNLDRMFNLSKAESFILFRFVLLVRIPVPPSGRLPAPLYREAGGAHIPIFIFVYFIFHLA